MGESSLEAFWKDGFLFWKQNTFHQLDGVSWNGAPIIETDIYTIVERYGYAVILKEGNFDRHTLPHNWCII